MGSCYRYAPKLDANQRQIVDALRAAGVTVQLLSRVGGGCPDLLCGAGGVSYLLEVKRPGQKPRPEQIEWAARWRGVAVQVVTNEREALDACGKKLQ